MATLLYTTVTRGVYSCLFITVELSLSTCGTENESGNKRESIYGNLSIRW